MADKFTEEQYQKIVEIVNEYPNFGKQFIVPNGGEGEWSTTYKELIKGIFGSIYRSEKHSSEVQYMLALANPLTREWAHDKFVEKEKRYVWTSKEVNSSRKHKRLYIQKQSASVRDYFVLDEHGYDDSELITESEIKKWGYDPERFYREEV